MQQPTSPSIPSLQTEHVKQQLKSQGFSVYDNEIRSTEAYKNGYEKLANVFPQLAVDGSRRRAFERVLMTPNMKKNALDLSPDSSFYLGTVYEQAAELNLEHNGARRHFAALPPDAYSNPLLKELVLSDFSSLPLDEFWVNANRNPILVGIHLVRMYATEGCPGVSSPNVCHQDGEPFTFVHLIQRHGITGGESEVFRSIKNQKGKAHPGEQLLHKTLEQPMETLAVFDRAVFHHITEVIVAEGFVEGYRDVVLIDFTPLEEAKFNSQGTVLLNPDNFILELNNAA